MAAIWPSTERVKGSFDLNVHRDVMWCGHFQIDITKAISRDPSYGIRIEFTFSVNEA
jgi:hypothetical protein